MNTLRNNSLSKRLARIALCAVAILGLSTALDGIGISFFAPQVAHAGTEKSDLEQKASWQEQYRTLLINQATLVDNAAKSRHNYAQAQRRNYPRGGARDQFLLDAAKAEAELAELKKETTDLLERARREDVPRNWFYEVDDEDIRPAAPAAAEEDDSREGRNPLYAK